MMKAKKHLSLPTIRRVAILTFGNDVFDKTRKGPIVKKRQVVQYVAHEIFKHSLEKTGMELGGQNHSTIIFSCKKVSNEINMYPDTKQLVDVFYNKCVSIGYTNDCILSINGLLKSRTVDVNMKVELRNLLKILKDGDNGI